MAAQSRSHKARRGGLPRRLVRGGGWLLSGLLGLAVVVWVILPLAIQYAIPRELARQGLSVTVRRAAIDPFAQTVSLYDARLITRTGVAIGWASIDARIDLRRLLSGRLRVTALRLQDARVELGVPIATPSPVASPSASGVAADIDRLNLEDVHLPSWPGIVDRPSLLRYARIDSVTALLAGKATRFDAEWVLGEAPLRLDGTLRLSAAATIARVRLAATSVDLSAFANAIRETGIKGVNGRIDAGGNLEVELAAGTRLTRASFDGNAWLTRLRAGAAGVALTDAELQWRGSIEAEAKTGSTLVTATGALDAPRILLATAGAMAGNQPLAVGFHNAHWQGRLSVGGEIDGDGVVSADRLSLGPSGRDGRRWSVRAEDLSGRMSTSDGPRLRDLRAAKVLVEWPQGKGSVKLTGDAIVATPVTFSAARGLRIARIESAALSGVIRRGAARSGDWRLLRLSAEKLRWDGALGVAALKTRAATIHIGPDTLELAAARVNEIRRGEDGMLRAARAGVENLHLSRVQGNRTAEGFATGLELTGLAIGRDGEYSSNGASAESVRWQQPDRGGLDLARLRVTGLTGNNARPVAIAKLAVGSGAWQGAHGSTAEIRQLSAGEVALSAAGELKSAAANIVGAELRDADGARWSADKLTGKRLQSTGRGAFRAAQVGAEELRHAPAAGIDGWRAKAPRLSGLTRTGDGKVTVEALAASGFTLAASAERPALRGGGIAATRLVVAADGAASAADATLKFVAADGESGRWRGTGFSAQRLTRTASGEIGAGLLRAARVEIKKDGAQELVAEGLDARESRITGATGALTVKAFGARTLRGDSGPSNWRSGALRGEALSGARATGYRLERLAVDGVKLDDPARDTRLETRSLEFSRLAYDATGLHGKSLRIDSIATAPAGAGMAGLAVRRVDIADIGWAPGAELAVGRVALEDLELTLAAVADGGWTVARFPRLASGAGAGVRIGEIAARAGGRVRLVDGRVEPAFRLTLGIQEARVRGFDTGTLGSDARFTLRLARDRFWNNSLEGRLTRTVDGFDVHAKGRIQGADLPALSPYVQAYLALRVLAGRADVDFDVAIERGALSGNSEIVLSGLRTETAPGAPDVVAAGASLRGTLALLADKKRTLRLKVPFSGQADDPKFNFGDLYAQALTKTARTALLFYLQPVGLALSAKSLFDKLAGMRFRPVLFASGAAQPGAEALSYLDQLAERLSDHPALKLGVCAKAVPRDGEVYAREARTAQAAGKVAMARSLTALAIARGRAVRAYLESERRVPASQLQDCPAAVENNPDAVPRVELLLAGAQPAAAQSVAPQTPAQSR